MKEKNKQKTDAISILRGVSIRLPLLIYGADVNITEDITIDQLPALVDNNSWAEFMPAGVTKAVFKKFIKYYAPDVFIAAGRKIRAEAYNADSLPPLERIRKIAALFSCFKNPDKETMLTPWRVVNMLKNKPENFAKKVLKKSYWNQNGGENMKFDAVVDNPPYQLTDGSGGTNDAPIYQHFVEEAQKLTSGYAALIVPSRWFTTGRENLLGDFRANMLNNPGIRSLYAYTNSR